jgi:hypothetical protein
VKEREMLFFYFVPDTTRNNKYKKSITYWIFFYAFLVVDYKHCFQHFHSFFFPAHAEKELGALIREIQSHGADGRRHAEDELQRTPGVEIDVQKWYVI